MKLKYALIGCGRIAPNHIAAAVNNAGDMDLAAVCDLIPQKADDLLSGFENIPQGIVTYTDHQKMLREVRPDFVAVATESGYHAEIALDAISAGCHVIVEKPIALSLHDARRMIDAAREKGVVLCACHQNRFNQSVAKIRSAVEEGRFGKLFHGAAHIRWNRGQSYYTQPWRGTWAEDGGALMNQCIHNIDLLRWMMGDEILEVSAFTDRLNHDYIEAEDLGLAIIKFKNGAYGLIEGTTNIYPANLEETLYVFGSRGTAKAGGKSVNVIEEWKFADALDDPARVKAEFGDDPPNVYGFGHTPLYADVIDAVKTGRAPKIDGEAGYRALELVLAIYKAAATGESVKFPITGNISTLDFKGRFQ